VSKALVEARKAKLAKAEADIEKNLLSFVVVGLRLKEIRDERLYEEDEYNDFPEYCERRWGQALSRAYQLINAAHIRGYLEANSTNVEFLPLAEGQARPLAKLGTERKPADKLWLEAWDRAVKAAKGQPPTEKIVEAVVDKMVKHGKASAMPDAEPWGGAWELDKIHLADVSQAEMLRRLPEGQVDFLITDPPWAPDEDKGYRLYEAAAKVALKCLKPGGRAAIYLGKLDLPLLLELIGGYLDYEWTFAAYQPAGAQLFRKTQFFESWRPIGIFAKPGPKPQTAYCPDAVVGTRDKSSHKWQQNLEPPLTLVGKYTAKGQVVMDPFVGGGTSLVACEKADGGRRRWVGFDNDVAAIDAATRRLAGLHE
jgi:hypothetical protein